MESFYTDLDQVLARTRNYEQTNLMGDRNAKVGEGKLEDIESVNTYALGARNMRATFCFKNNKL